MTYLLGLTGGIASGKSTISQFFKSKQIPVIDADIVAREVVEPNTTGLNQIVAHFGEGILVSNGELNRKKLGSIIFEDDKKRERLNTILSDEIRENILRKISDYKKKEQPLIVLDIPLLYEGGYDKIVDRVMVCYVPKQVQLSRLMSRDSLSEVDALKRIESQMDLEEKKRLADVVIDNSGSIEETLKQVDNWLTHFS
ncbi:dephospho-CoA kinase [Vagococcus luciliae]|uniref:Dephospho-CoA kinase n=1 Tax=Vagococcus luciliae TaxID=2920380 RepID=A0ABY5P0Z6_9ENTE|nr:dephospho-CoA kinase [Vagococcus luciliae]UUV99388.1 Dephospho-CoA kinase [Vagococcus luciliae]